MLVQPKKEATAYSGLCVFVVISFNSRRILLFLNYIHSIQISDCCVYISKCLLIFFILKNTEKNQTNNLQHDDSSNPLLQTWMINQAEKYTSNAFNQTNSQANFRSTEGRELYRCCKLLNCRHMSSQTPTQKQGGKQTIAWIFLKQTGELDQQCELLIAVDKVSHYGLSVQSPWRTRLRPRTDIELCSVMCLMFV